MEVREGTEKIVRDREKFEKFALCLLQILLAPRRCR